MRKRTQIRITVCLLLPLLLGAAACGQTRTPFFKPTDAADRPVVTETPAPTEAPIPTPMPQIVVCAPPSAEQFLARAVTNEASLRRCTVKTLDTLAPDGRTAVVLYRTGAAEETAAANVLLSKGIPLVIYAPSGTDVPQGAVAVRAANESRADEMMELALAYPPHDTPVRLLGLFESEKSEAARLFQAYADAGKVLSKGIFFPTEAAPEVSEWLTHILGTSFPGMIDGIYAESAALAEAAAEAMLAAEREDMEIFCPDCSLALLDKMREHPRLIAGLCGADEAKAAETCILMAERLLEGGAPESMTLPAQPIGLAAALP